MNSTVVIDLQQYGQSNALVGIPIIKSGNCTTLATAKFPWVILVHQINTGILRAEIMYIIKVLESQRSFQDSSSGALWNRKIVDDGMHHVCYTYKEKLL